MNNTIKERIFNLVDFKFNGEISFKEFDGVRVEYDGKDAVIGYRTKPQLARGYFLLAKEVSKNKGAFSLSQKPHFDDFGVMLDVSRGGVMTVESIKKYLDYMAALGFNVCMLYMEDLFELKDFPLFGYMRGRYTTDELRQIDDYAYEMGIEVIPNIELLGHLGQFLRWEPTTEIRDDTQVLLVGEPKTYEFVEAVVSTLSKTFRSRRIDINMDEPDGLGLGRYLTLNGYREAKDVFNEHLHRVVDICKKYGYERPITDSDVYFYNPLKEDYALDTVVPQDVIDSIPDVALVFWDYYHTDINFYNENMRKHKAFNKEIIFCGSLWTPQGFVPNFRTTFNMAIPGLKSSIQNNIKFYFATLWNDGGWETNYMSAICGLPIFSEYCYIGENCTEEEIFDVIGYLTKADKPLMEAISDFHLGYDPLTNIGRGIVYCDLLFDTLCIDVDFAKASQTYKNALSVFENYKHIEFYGYYKALFGVCALKTEVLARLRSAYKDGDKAYLGEVANEIIPRLRALYGELYREFKLHWNNTNKPNALEMYCHRFGGIDFRLENVAEIINDYLDGKKDTIAELQEEVVGGINQKGRFAHEFVTTYRQ